MSDNTAVTCALNLVLCGATGFGLFKIGPSEHPWAFTSCLIGFTHGLVGLVGILADDDNAKKMQIKTGGILEIVSLPLVNVDLYLETAESNNIALGHGLFMVPLTVSVILAFWKDEGAIDVSGTVQTLKVLTILGNITSLAFVMINESSVIMGGMAVLAFMAKFGADLCEEHIHDDIRLPIQYLSWSGFFVLSAFAVASEK
ncbi:uncharacterized protein [Drosophila kikkawai]|uniref:Uncharacterized protein n=1 Tax=Drosophila kikkawai TaxID=30033 RepID=A0A6P4HZ77_DROKI|nr:uncharacterized protein LOC108074277 [Drosophila kikkawai]